MPFLLTLFYPAILQDVQYMKNFLVLRIPVESNMQLSTSSFSKCFLQANFISKTNCTFPKCGIFPKSYLSSTAINSVEHICYLFNKDLYDYLRLRLRLVMRTCFQLKINTKINKTKLHICYATLLGSSLGSPELLSHFLFEWLQPEYT